MRQLALLTVAAALACTGALTGAANAHRDPCHSGHSCPSDHHSYSWNGLSCTSYADEKLASDSTVKVVGGRTYWCHPESGSTTQPSTSTGGSSAPSNVPVTIAVPALGTPKARLLLARLRVRPAATMAGYSRARFGPAWSDVDGNHCDTRDDILRRDLKQVGYRAGSSCVIATGTLRDPYTGRIIRFVRGVGTSTAVQIDHVVALAAAWRTGAAGWTASKRLHYANDPAVLLAVDGPQNESKSDGDASEWLPPNRAFDCTYVKRQIAVKSTYRLWVTAPERLALRRALSLCR